MLTSRGTRDAEIAEAVRRSFSQLSPDANARMIEAIADAVVGGSANFKARAIAFRAIEQMIRNGQLVHPVQLGDGLAPNRVLARVERAVGGSQGFAGIPG